MHGLDPTPFRMQVYASEILGIVLQNSEHAREELLSLDLVCGSARSRVQGCKLGNERSMNYPYGKLAAINMCLWLVVVS